MKGYEMTTLLLEHAGKAVQVDVQEGHPEVIAIINAAPELLEALQEVRRWQHEPWDEGDTHTNVELIDHANRIDAAIAKATEDDVSDATEVAEELGVEDRYFPPNGATADTPAHKGGAK